MKTLAIDPGNFNTAYCLLDEGKISAIDKVPNETFFERYRNMLRLNHPAEVKVATECVMSYGMAVGASVFETCYIIGRLIEIAQNEGHRLDLVPRLCVKLAICKSPKANDSNIRAALIDLFGPPGTKKNPGPTYGITADRWAALGLAVTVARGDYAPYVWSHDRK